MLLGATPSDQIHQQAHGAWPQWAVTYFVTLAAHGSEGGMCPRSGQLQITDFELCSLGRPDAGVVEEQQQGTLAAALPGGAAGSIE